MSSTVWCASISSRPGAHREARAPCRAIGRACGQEGDAGSTSLPGRRGRAPRRPGSLRVALDLACAFWEPRIAASASSSFAFRRGADVSIKQGRGGDAIHGDANQIPRASGLRMPRRVRTRNSTKWRRGHTGERQPVAGALEARPVRTIGRYARPHRVALEDELGRRRRSRSRIRRPKLLQIVPPPVGPTASPAAARQAQLRDGADQDEVR